MEITTIGYDTKGAKGRDLNSKEENENQQNTTIGKAITQRYYYDKVRMESGLQEVSFKSLNARSYVCLHACAYVIV